MSRPLLAPFVLVLALLGAAQLPACTSSPAAASWDLYGSAISNAAPLSLDELLADPAAFDGRTVTVEATIDEACQAKGCWMTFVGDGETVRVTFKDYAFFVPLESAGRTARVQGVFRIREVPVDEARHYLEDAGRADEAAAITEPQQAYELVATGVRLRAAS